MGTLRAHLPWAGLEAHWVRMQESLPERTKPLTPSLTAAFPISVLQSLGGDESIRLDPGVSHEVGHT